METVLVSGATGFLGSHLVKNFVINGYNVIALKRKNSNLNKIKQHLDKISIYDIDDYDVINQIFIQNKIDVVINASVAYDRADNNPHDVIDSNLLLPAVLLDLASKNGSGFFINTDSYFTHMHYNRMKNYTLSKKQFKEWLLLYNKDIKIFNLVLMHIYGDSDNPDKFIPFVIKSILSGEREINLTSGAQKKDFIFIDDLCSLFILLLKTTFAWPNDFYEYIVGSGDLTSVRDVVEIIKQTIPESNTKLNFGMIDNNEADVDKIINADLIKLKNSFNWQPDTSIRAGLEKTINYYRFINEE